MSNILTVNELSANYGEVPALTNVSINVPIGSIVTIIGPNGAGKSTLLGSIMSSLPTQSWVRGAIGFQGVDVGSMTVGEKVEMGMCLVPEKRELFGTMSVEENLRLGWYTQRLKPNSNLLTSMQEVFDVFPRLEERRKQEANTLSGGERQMLAVGRALMAKPKLLMLDEPSLGLAPIIVKEIFRIICKLRDAGVSILLVEQNARAALKVADYGYVLETGEIALEGPGYELEKNPRIAQMYLGVANSKLEVA